jgi:hypothetical protein
MYHTARKFQPRVVPTRHEPFCFSHEPIWSTDGGSVAVAPGLQRCEFRWSVQKSATIRFRRWNSLPIPVQYIKSNAEQIIVQERVLTKPESHYKLNELLVIIALQSCSNLFLRSSVQIIECWLSCIAHGHRF